MVPREHLVEKWPGAPPPQEGYSDISGSSAKYPSSSKTTAADGTFHDIPVGICSNMITNITWNLSQDIQIVTSDGNTYKVRHNDYQFTSTTLFNHGTVTNGSDIKVTQ